MKEANRTFLSSIVYLLIFLTFSNNSLFGKDIDDIIAEMQKKYRDTEAILIQFKEISRFSLTGTQTEVMGTLKMKGKNNFRLESEDQVLVSNGETLWRYNKIEDQVLIDNARKDEQEVEFNNFLYELEDHYFSQKVDETEPDGEKIYTIKLTPKPSEQSYFTSIKVWVEEDSWEVKRVIYTDYNDNETEYIVEEINFDPSFAENTFTFSPPEGARVVDLRF